MQVYGIVLVPVAGSTIVWLIRVSIVIKHPCSGSKRGLLQFYTNTVEKGATLWLFGVPSAYNSHGRASYLKVQRWLANRCVLLPFRIQSHSSYSVLVNTCMHFRSNGPLWCIVIVTGTAVSQIGGCLVGFVEGFFMEFFHGFSMSSQGGLIRNSELALLDSGHLPVFSG
jgi:hypothetical protein